jgi:hypothetical protein
LDAKLFFPIELAPKSALHKARWRESMVVLIVSLVVDGGGRVID